MRSQWVLEQLTRLVQLVPRRAMWVLVAATTVATASGVAAEVGHLRANAAKDVTTTYTYDRESEQWVKSTKSVTLPRNQDGTMPQGSNTVEVFLEEGEPVKAIILAEALIKRGTEPLLEVAGRVNPSTGVKGDIRICKLIVKQVDAARLEIKDTKVVRLDSFNVLAKDDELDVEIEPVNVVRCGRGANTVLAAGIDRKDLDIGSSENGNGSDVSRLFEILGKEKESGLRVDRVRVLGPEGKTGFIENLIVLRTSVFGRIEVRDVKIQHAILDSVTLDDLTP